jgi:hypothetical protein
MSRQMRRQQQLIIDHLELRLSLPDTELVTSSDKRTDIATFTKLYHAFIRSRIHACFCKQWYCSLVISYILAVSKSVGESIFRWCVQGHALCSIGHHWLLDRCALERTEELSCVVSKNRLYKGPLRFLFSSSKNKTYSKKRFGDAIIYSIC